MTSLRYVSYLLTISVAVLAEPNETQPNLVPNHESVSNAKPVDNEWLLAQFGEIVCRMEEKFDQQFQCIHDKLNEVTNRLRAVDSKLQERIEVAYSKQQNETVSQCSSGAPLEANELGKLSNQLTLLTVSNEKRIERLECKIHEQFQAITVQEGKRALLGLLYAPSHECHRDWIVFQQRFDGNVNFLRNWTEYERGFGQPGGEFWLGLEVLSATLATGRHELHVLLETFSGEIAYAHYDDFRLGNASEQYRLVSVGAYSGTAGDSLAYHQGQPFSTPDEDNDAHRDVNCADLHDGAWWYRSCIGSNLNGKYQEGSSTNLMHWPSFQDTNGLKSSAMMIRPYSSQPAAATTAKSVEKKTSNE